MFYVAGAAILFASKGLFSKALYQRGVGFELLVTVRALLAMPLFVWFAFRSRGGATGGTPIPWKACAGAAVAGITCYYVGAMVDFWALELIDASIERVLLFSYPALVVLIAALTTAIYFLIGERYVHELGSTRFAAIGMSSSAIVLALHFAVFRSFDEVRALDAHSWLLLIVLGIACMFVPGLMQAEGVRRVGAQRAAIGSTVGPPTTIVLAALFLGERLNGWQLLGSAMIVGSVLILSLGKSAPE
jgi:drug/metabolite transporter (DMT)-like permease